MAVLMKQARRPLQPLTVNHKFEPLTDLNQKKTNRPAGAMHEAAVNNERIQRIHDSPQATSAKEWVPATLYDWTKNLNNTELQIWKPPLHKMKNRNETTIGQRDEKKDNTIKTIKC